MLTNLSLAPCCLSTHLKVGSLQHRQWVHAHQTTAGLGSGAAAAAAGTQPLQARHAVGRRQLPAAPAEAELSAAALAAPAIGAAGLQRGGDVRVQPEVRVADRVLDELDFVAPPAGHGPPPPRRLILLPLQALDAGQPGREFVGVACSWWEAGRRGSSVCRRGVKASQEGRCGRWWQEAG